MAKPINLIVLLGAGASHGCDVGATAFVNPRFRPPLTCDLFKPHEEFEKIFEKFHIDTAATLFARQSKTGNMPLEAFLYALQRGGDPIRKCQAFRTALYLQELFSTVSAKYLTNGSNRKISAKNAYTYLVSEIHEKFYEKTIGSVSFVTLNYDLLLEHALMEHFNLPGFGQLSHYINFRPGWSLIKFHGSVNWWYPLAPSVGANYPSDSPIERTLRAINNVENLETHFLKDEIRVLPSLHTQRSHEPGQPIFFPALALPVSNKYTPICPEKHLKVLRDVFLESHYELLVIGFAGKDEDVLTEIRSSTGSLTKIKIVCGDRTASEGTLSNMKLGPVIGAPFFDGNFQTFVTEGGLTQFLN